MKRSEFQQLSEQEKILFMIDKYIERLHEIRIAAAAKKWHLAGPKMDGVAVSAGSLSMAMAEMWAEQCREDPDRMPIDMQEMMAAQRYTDEDLQEGGWI